MFYCLIMPQSKTHHNEGNATAQLPGPKQHPLLQISHQRLEDENKHMMLQHQDFTGIMTPEKIWNIQQRTYFSLTH